MRKGTQNFEKTCFKILRPLIPYTKRYSADNLMERFLFSIEENDSLAFIGIDRDGFARCPAVGLQIINRAGSGELHRFLTLCGRMQYNHLIVRIQCIVEVEKRCTPASPAR